MLGPVSYTHLDVYKRQPFGCVPWDVKRREGEWKYSLKKLKLSVSYFHGNKIRIKLNDFLSKYQI